jgi:transcriptional regulator with XRE-family HTH domain
MSRKDNQIGEAISRRREEAALSLGELAADAGVSKSYLWRLESGDGEVRPSGRTLYRIAGALGTTMSDLLGREILADDPTDMPPSLVEFAKQRDLTPREKQMLAQINFRGRQPETVDDWEFLWTAIERSVPARPSRRATKGAGGPPRTKKRGSREA